MLKHPQISINVGMIFLLVFCLCGFSNTTIKDIETAFIKQDYDKAKLLAEQLLKNKSASSLHNEVRYYSGLCDLRLGRYALARTVFTGLTKKKLNVQLRDKSFLGIFDTYYLNGQYKEANKIINRLIKVSPKSEFLSLVYLKLARVNLKLANWYNARQYLKKITNEFPNSLEVHTAKQLLNEKQYFAVQVGAFMDRDRAEKLVTELQQKDEYAYIVETIDQKDRTFFRVRVGQLVLLDKAQKLKLKLSKEGYPTQIYP